MNKNQLGTLAAACAALFVPLAAAGTEPGSWYVAPQIQGIWLDDARNADDDAGFAFSFGRAASEKWNFELGAFTSEHDAAANQKLKLQGWEVVAQRVFYRESAVQPYLLVGFGRLETRSALDKDSLMLKYGLGVLADIVKNIDAGTNLQLRGEVAARRADAPVSGSLVDYFAGIGLQYSWGATPPPKPPADSDGDGVIDPNDKCPNTPPGTRVDANGCELDSDGDGVVDSRDQCPNTPPGTKVDARGCELDSDGDGVVDSKDECPDTPPGTRVDFRGCPFTTEIQLPRVVFDTDSATLRPESYAVLDGAVSTLQRYPDLNVEVAGHTDSVGSDAYNRALSQRRADAVLAYLRDKGVANALRARGYGESQPIADNRTEEGRQKNRRVTLRIITR